MKGLLKLNFVSIGRYSRAVGPQNTGLVALGYGRPLRRYSIFPLLLVTHQFNVHSTRLHVATRGQKLTCKIHVGVHQYICILLRLMKVFSPSQS